MKGPTAAQRFIVKCVRNAKYRKEKRERERERERERRERNEKPH